MKSNVGHAQALQQERILHSIVVQAVKPARLREVPGAHLALEDQ